MTTETLCRRTCELAIKAGDFISRESLRFSPHHVEYKGKHNLVSYVDKTAEQKLAEGLSKLLPGSGFITEENTVRRKEKDYTWVIDPLDGTTNFIHGIPCYAVSIGLLKEGMPVMGVVYEINRKECFYAWEGSMAFLNGKPIRVSAASSPSESLMATGFPYTNYSRMKEYMEVFAYCMRNTRGIRRLGSAAADLAYVACGRFDGFFEYGLNPWDVAAGAFIVRQAGGRISDFSGKDNYIFGKEILACNASVFDKIFKVIKHKFGKK